MNKIYDLETRTFQFAKDIGQFYEKIKPISLENHEYLKQLIRSSGSIAANILKYISTKG